MQDEEQEMSGSQVTPEEPKYEEPSKAISYVAKGEEYLEFQWISDRLVFAEKLSQRQRDREIIKLALGCLQQKMKKIQEESGKSFVPADATIVGDGND